MRVAASVTLLFRELPILERFAAARACGFDGVEIQRLYEGDPQEMARAARDAGLEVVLVNVGLGDFLDGGPGLSGVPGREDAFREALEAALAAAAELSAHHVHLGPSRIPDGVAAADCHRVYADNVRLALHLSRAGGTSLLIEGMNPVDVPTALLPNVAAAAAAVNAGDSPRLGLQFDLYHIAMAGQDPVEQYQRHHALVRHVQFADAPGRHEPGTAQLDIPGTLRAIRDAGYQGWVGAEYRPLGATADRLAWLPILRAFTPEAEA